MKKSVFYITLCLFTLSSAYCRAERRKVKQNFEDMYRSVPAKLTLEDSQKTGVTDSVTYTCTSGARFSANYEKTGSKLAIFLESAGAQVTTTVIENLDSLCIYYAPNAKKEMIVSIKEGEGEWTEVPVVQRQNGLSTVQMPRAGDYSVRIARGDNNVYIKEIDYFYIDLSECPNCFLYKPE